MRTEAEWQERERQLLARNSELVERARALVQDVRTIHGMAVTVGYESGHAGIEAITSRILGESARG